ncbi:YbaY family lipoprotein [Shewanella youngdeokensis]|uniref:YbaY family lipoprotein n=1 Tax=Shewanella youngdeokensis TaxID=2999068 RepID=A0ABZ0JV33_9GAMM|nr:YbaY family lipoprotein [Shewanella sp. DAU334]
MKAGWKPLLFLVAVSLLSGCAASNAMVEIHGEVWYKERLALPADAVMTVKLQEVSLRDAPTVVIAQFERGNVSTPTLFQFLLRLDQFKQGHTYTVAASIRLNDQLMFITDQTYRIDLDSVEPMSVLLQKVTH